MISLKIKHRDELTIIAKSSDEAVEISKSNSYGAPNEMGEAWSISGFFFNASVA